MQVLAQERESLTAILAELKPFEMHAATLSPAPMQLPKKAAEQVCLPATRRLACFSMAAACFGSSAGTSSSLEDRSCKWACTMHMQTRMHIQSPAHGVEPHRPTASSKQ